MNNQACARKLEYQTPIKKSVPNKVFTKRWQFKPRSFWPFLTWGFVMFLGVRLILLPLAEGIYNFSIKTREVNELKVQKQTMERQLVALTKKRDYMKTTSYIEERAHQIGFIKANEAQVMVIDTQGNPVNTTHRNRVIEINN